MKNEYKYAVRGKGVEGRVAERELDRFIRSFLIIGGIVLVAIGLAYWL